jgi:hypothetical protein
VAPEVHVVASLPVESEVFLGGAPAASLATFNDGSTTTKGMICLVVVSSPAALSSAPCFERLGSEASALEEKKNGESVPQPAQEEFEASPHQR